MKQLGELQKNLDKFRALNTNLVSITHDPEDPEKMRAKAGVTFTLYSDPDLKAITAFDVLDEANSIAHPAAFIVSTNGRVLFKYVGENASDTVLLKVLIAELEKLQPPAP